MVEAALWEDEGSSLPVVIEVRNEEKLREALGAGAEAVTLGNVRAYAETGADYVECEALTQTAPFAEFALLVDSCKEK